MKCRSNGFGSSETISHDRDDDESINLSAAATLSRRIGDGAVCSDHQKQQNSKKKKKADRWISDDE
jgi:hypothetical protein